MRVAGGRVRARLRRVVTNGSLLRAGIFLLFFALAVVPSEPATGTVQDNRFPATNQATSDVISPPSVPDLDAASDTGFLNEVSRTATLRPTSDVLASNITYSSGTTGWNLVDEAALNINDWFQTNANGHIFVGFPDGVLPANARITQVVIKANISNSAPAGSAAVAVRRPSNGETDVVGWIPQAAPASQTFTLAARPWDEGAWTVADVDGLQVGFFGPNTYPKLKVRQLWVEVGYWTSTPAGYDTDNNTTDSTPSFSGTVDPAVERVELYEGMTLLGTDDTVSGGAWSITSAYLADGVHQIKARSILAAEQADSDALSVTIGTQLTARLAPASDTGPATPVSRTLKLRPVADVAISGDVVLTSGTTGWNLIDEVILNTGNNVHPRNGSATFSFPTTGLDPTLIVEQVTVKANVRNKAPANNGGIFLRNPASGTTYSIASIGQNPPALQTIARTIRPWDSRRWTVADVDALQVGVSCGCASYPNFRLDQLWVEITYQSLEKGAYGTDRLTNQAAPTLAGTTTFNAARVDVLEGGVVVASDNAPGPTGWQATLPALSEGPHTFTFEVYDADGVLAGWAPALTVTVDLTPPPAPSTPDLDPSSDTGVHDNDDLTTDTTPSFNGTVPVGAVNVELYAGTERVGTDTTVETGAWNITSVLLPIGSHQIAARATDDAGNQASSPTLSLVEILDYLIRLKVYSSPTGDVGSANWASVVVQDETGQPLDTFTGTVTLSSTDPGASWPDGNVFEMVSGQSGAGHSVRIRFGSQGSHTVKATAAGASKGTSAPIVVADSSLELTAPATAYPGVPFALRLVPRNADGAVAHQYAALVTLTSTDSEASFGPEVNSQGQYQFECACEGGKTFSVKLSSLGQKSITITDPYGHSEQVTVNVVSAPTTGANPIAAITAVRWGFGDMTDFYVDAHAPFTLLSVDDVGQGNFLLGSGAFSFATDFGPGRHQFSASTSRGGYFAGDPELFDVAYHVVTILNSDRRKFSIAVWPVERFSQVPSKTSYDELDPGNPVASWQVVGRGNGRTRLSITAHEPFRISDIKYGFGAPFWVAAAGGAFVAAGTHEIEITDVATQCYGGRYYNNTVLKMEVAGVGGRIGRLRNLNIPPASDAPSGACTQGSFGGLGSQDWLADFLDDLGDIAERGLSTVGDPVDASDGYLRGPVTDFSLGGLAPGLEFGRVYDGGLAQAGEPATGGLLGPGWSSSLDWRIVTFGQDPEGVIISADGGREIAFIRNADGSYYGVGSAPFTFKQVQNDYELRRLDGSGYRFNADGRLEAVLDHSGREMTLAYDAGGHLASFTDAAGRTATVTTVDGRITLISLPDGRQVGYEYDTDGRLVGVTDLAGYKTSFELDALGRITRIRDDGGAVVLQNLYDGEGRVIRQTDGAGAVTNFTYDPALRMTRAIGPRGDVTTLCFNSHGWLVTTFDALGGRRDIDYDAHGHPRAFTDELGATTRIKNDAFGRPKRVKDPLGRVVTLDYNAAGDLTQLVDANGRTLTVAYGANDLPSSVTASNGANTKQLVAYTYDTLDQVATVAEPGGAVTTVDFDADGYLSSLIDSEGGVTIFGTDARGYVTSIVDPLGNAPTGIPAEHESVFAFDAMGRPTSNTDPTGATTTRTYDAMGRLLSLTDPAGIVTAYEYDGAGRLTRETVQGGATSAVTEFEYDPAGNLTAIVDPEDRRIEFTYDLLGRSIETRDQDGKSWLTAYDAKGRVVSRTDPTGRVETLEYNAIDQVVKQTDAGGHETTFDYDDAGRVASVTDALDGVTEYDYDWLGRLSTVTDALNHETDFAYNAANDLVSVTDALDRLTRFQYDDAHRLTTVIDALLGETSYEYDEAGRLVRRENARGYAELYQYDAAGRLTQLTDPLNSTWQTAYGIDGRIDHTIDAEGQQTDFGYDELGRLVTVSPDTGSDITFTYDLSDRRLSMSDGAGTTSYGYDPVGRLTDSTRAGRSVGYAYDDAGRLSSVAYPGSLGSVSLAYDTEGRLESVIDWASRVTTFGYDALDRPTSIARPGALLSAFGYDALSRVTSIQHAYDGTPVMSLGYVYDAAGNVTERTDDQGTTTFGYDDLDRLTAADYPGTNDYAYGYDPAGNLTTVTTPAGATAHTYDAADRISDTGFVYDANGSLLTDGTRSLAYDALGRLTGVTSPSLAATYTLDGEGNRLSETVNSVTTDFDLDLRGLPTALVAGDRSYLPGMPSVGYAQGGNWLGSLTDAQGSAVQTIDAAGVTGALVRFDPYGGIRPGSTAAAGIGYTGEWADPTGLVNLRFRAYDPTLGRFLSRDNFGGIPNSPLTGNRHAYGIGNPLTYVDPSGHFVSGLLQDPGMAISFAIQMVPGIGDAYSLFTGVTGWDPIANYNLNGFERQLAYAAALPFVPALAGPMGKSLGALAKNFGRGFDAVAGAFKVSRIADLFSGLRGFARADGLGSLRAVDGVAGSLIQTRRTVAGLTNIGDEGARGGVYLLRDPVTRQVMRTGRTNNLGRRATEHLRDPVLRDYNFEVAFRTDLKAEQRGLEQLVHDAYTPPLNRINPVDSRNQRFDEYLQSAYDFLDTYDTR